MAGRHALVESTKSFMGTPAAKGLAGATTAGLLLGLGAPAAFASPKDNVDAAGAIAPLTTSVSNAAWTMPSVTVDAAAGEWEIETVKIDVQAPVVPEAPVVETVTVAATGNRATTTTRTTTTRNTAVTTTRAAATQAAAPAVSSAPASGKGAQIVAIARQYSGTRYVYGGTTPSGWDCSGFTSFVYRQVGVSLPRSSGAQLSAGVRVPASQARPGDLVWWPGHVGIYTGNGNHIAARNPSDGTYEGPIYGSPVYIRVV